MKIIIDIRLVFPHWLWRWDLLSNPDVFPLVDVLPVTLSYETSDSIQNKKHRANCFIHLPALYLHIANHFLKRSECRGMPEERQRTN